MSNWFQVDKEGLAKLVERRGKVFILHELLQNAWDCDGTTNVAVTLTPIANKPYAEIKVVDDHPEGFKNLTHAYTLFAESEKKSDPRRRGRFNLGEKLVLALCEEATITSTTGVVKFTKNGGRQESRQQARAAGTVFSGIVRMTRQEVSEVLSEAARILPPENIKTTINEYPLQSRQPLKSFYANLRTENADEHGILHRPHRKTLIDIHNRLPNEPPLLYEMGIPVMELGDDPFHVNVGQKVPMSMERDAVTATWLKDLRACVLDNCHHSLDATSTKGRWIGDALEASDEPEAVRAVIEKRFGDKVVIADPSDHEGENIAKSQGYVVIPGGAFTAAAWSKIKEAEAALPAGQVTPSPKPFSPDGAPLILVPESMWSPAMCDFAQFVQNFGRQVARLHVGSDFTLDKKWPFNAAYCKTGSLGGVITWNIGRLTDRFFTNRHHQYNLLFHEIGHHWGGHLDSSYHVKLTWMAAEALRLSMLDPDFRKTFI